MCALHRGRGLGERGVVANASKSLSDTNNISLLLCTIQAGPLATNGCLGGGRWVVVVGLGAGAGAGG